jgi:hypothetical protein
MSIDVIGRSPILWDDEESLRFFAPTCRGEEGHEKRVTVINRGPEKMASRNDRKELQMTTGETV